MRTGKNHEGYSDPTASCAVGHLTHEEKQREAGRRSAAQNLLEQFAGPGAEFFAGNHHPADRELTLSEYCLPFVKVGGWFVPYKSGKLEEEMKTGKGAIRKLGGELEDVISFHLANEDERNLVRIHKTERTGKKYPRKAGTPSREPLK